MCTFIARMIESAYDKSEGAGKAKYRAYFVSTKIYAKWKEDVDTILITDGYENAIVTQ